MKKYLKYLFISLAVVLIGLGLVFVINHTPSKSSIPSKKALSHQTVVFSAPAYDKVFSWVKYDPNFGFIIHYQNGDERIIRNYSLRHKIVITDNDLMTISLIFRGEDSQNRTDFEPINFQFGSGPGAPEMREILKQKGCFITTSTLFDKVFSHYIF